MREKSIAKVLKDSLSPTNKRITTLSLSLTDEEYSMLLESPVFKVLNRKELPTLDLALEEVMAALENSRFNALDAFMAKEALQSALTWVYGKSVTIDDSSAVREVFLGLKEDAPGVELCAYSGITKLLAPYLQRNVICTSTQWDEIIISGRVTSSIREALENSTPSRVLYGEYHLGAEVSLSGHTLTPSTLLSVYSREERRASGFIGWEKP